MGRDLHVILDYERTQDNRERFNKKTYEILAICEDLCCISNPLAELSLAILGIRSVFNSGKLSISKHEIARHSWPNWA